MQCVLLIRCHSRCCRVTDLPSSVNDSYIDEPDVEISVGDSDTPEAAPDDDSHRDGDVDDGGADDRTISEPTVRQNFAEIWLWMDIRTGHW